VGRRNRLVHTIIGATLLTAVGIWKRAWTAAFLQYSHGMDLQDRRQLSGATDRVSCRHRHVPRRYLADVLAKRNMAGALVVTAGVLFAVPFSFGRLPVGTTGRPYFGS